ncbi:hypothetical protein [Spongiimicrobium sp. 3-5]|uniref:hypothetical protein n=1 Tax=Spongiimicrobium sp. 3-5 TaxID=3332596 RepID=UPI00398073F3
MKQLLLCIALLATACKSQQNSAAVKTGKESADNLELLLQDGYAGITEAAFMVVKDQKTLKGFYSKINRTRKPGIVPPYIDFNKELVVIFCNGETSENMLPSLFIDTETDGELILGVKPLKNLKTPTKAMVTSPFCIYKIPLTEKQISLTNHKVSE